MRQLRFAPRPEPESGLLACAELLVDRGRLAEAEVKALSALERARDGGALVEAAAALLCLARIHARGGDLSGARAHISEARDLMDWCEDRGTLTQLLIQSERLAAENAPDPAAGRYARVRRSDGLTSREAEVLRLVATGDTNQEIAGRLVLSVHTVERHLQNAYRKVGVRNRADAAAYIVLSTG